MSFASNIFYLEQPFFRVKSQNLEAAGMEAAARKEQTASAPGEVGRQRSPGKPVGAACFVPRTIANSPKSRPQKKEASHRRPLLKYMMCN